MHVFRVYNCHIRLHFFKKMTLECHIYLTYIPNTKSFPGQQWLNMWHPSLSRANEQSQLLSGPETVNCWSLFYRSAWQCVGKPCWSHPHWITVYRKMSSLWHPHILLLGVKSFKIRKTKFFYLRKTIRNMCIDSSDQSLCLTLKN